MKSLPVLVRLEISVFTNKENGSKRRFTCIIRVYYNKEKPRISKISILNYCLLVLRLNMPFNSSRPTQETYISRRACR